MTDYRRGRVLTTTLPGRATTGEATDAKALGFALVASEEEPHRAAEVGLLEPYRFYVLGRGGPNLDAFLLFGPQRPGVPFAPEGLASCLDGKTLSREQLRLRATALGIEMEQIGQCKTFVNGVPCRRALLKVGDTVLLKGAVLLLVVERPWTLAAPAVPLPMHPFGEADARGRVGESLLDWSLREAIAMIALTDDDVIIRGETGTGKEGVAAALRALSRRAQRVYVTLNIAVVPKDLVAPELFGKIANYPNPGPAIEGHIQRAEGGTLLLDELGDAPEAVQAALLRVLQERTSGALGGGKERKIDVRFFAASHRDDSAFREDLRFRFAQTIHVPPIRQHPEDIYLLLRHLFRTEKDTNVALPRFCVTGRNGEPQLRVDLALVDYLVRHPLRGNMRELRSLLKQAMNESPGDRVRLPPSFPPLPAAVEAAAPPASSGPSSSGVPAPSSVPSSSVPSSSRASSREKPAKERLLAVLESVEWSIRAAADALGTSRPSIRRWMAEYGIVREGG